MVNSRIRVKVEASYVPEKSDITASLYFFAYHVSISNESDDPVQLISRHWKIRDAFGRIQEVKGLGVVGQQPYIRPGESFEYSSCCPLPTEYGHMKGTYQFQNISKHDDKEFDVAIPTFELVSPQAVN